MNNDTVIFYLKDPETYPTMRFYRHFCDNKALGHLKDDMKPILVKTKDWYILGFITTAKDYKKLSETHANTEKVYDIKESGKHQLVYGKEGKVGELQEIPPDEAHLQKEFFYRPDLNKYWMIT